MSNVPLLPAPRLSVEVERSLIEQTEHRMLAPARSAGYELSLVGATVLPQRQTIARTQWGTWLFVDHLADPTAKEYNGRIPVPSNQIPRLIELGRHGFRPQFVFIAHQLPGGYREGDPLPQLVPTCRNLREKDERLKLQLAKAMRLYLKGIFTILAAPLIVTGGAAAGLGLDPIIFGGVKHPELPVVMWCVVAQWEWE